MINRREFLKKVGVVGGLAVISPLGLVDIFGRELPINNIESFGTKIIDSDLGVAGAVSALPSSGTAVWSVLDETSLVHPVGITKVIKVSVVTPGTLSTFDILYNVNTKLSDIGRVILPVYSTFPTGTITTAISIGEEAALTNSYVYSRTHLNEIGWDDFIRLRYEPTSIVGSPSYSNTSVRVRIRIQVSAGAIGSLYIGSLYSNPRTITKIAIGFDDRNQTEFDNAYSYMQPRGIPGYTAVISTFGSLTVGSMQTMIANGWSVHNHTATHPHMLTLTEAQIRSEVESCRTFLINNGLANSGDKVFVYPFGEGDSFTDSIIGSYYEKLVRPGGTSLFGFSGQLVRDVVPKSIITRIPIDNPATFAEVEVKINRLIEVGVSGVLNGHNPVNGAQVGHTELSTLKSIIDLLYRYNQAGVIRCVNLNEMITGLAFNRKRRL